MCEQLYSPAALMLDRVAFHSLGLPVATNIGYYKTCTFRVKSALINSHAKKLPNIHKGI